MTEAEETLHGRCVLVTRPADQAEKLIALIKTRGGDAIHIPALAVESLEPDSLIPAIALMRQLHTFQHVVFISFNAVRFGLDLIRKHRGDLSGMPSCYAVGPVTAAALREADIEVTVPSGAAGSEELAALSSLQSLEGQRVLIFRGINGREDLAETLGEKGAEVRYCEVYRRTCPKNSGPLLRAALQEGQVDAVIAASIETLNNLLVLAGGEADTLRSLPICVFGERMAVRARQSRCTRVIQAQSGDSEAMVDVLATALA